MSAEAVQGIVKQAADDVAMAVRVLEGAPFDHKVHDFTKDWTYADFLSYIYCVALIAAQVIRQEEVGGEVLVELLNPAPAPAEFDPAFAALQIISAASREDAQDVFALVPEDEARMTVTTSNLIAITAKLIVSVRPPPDGGSRGGR